MDVTFSGLYIFLDFTVYWTPLFTGRHFSWISVSKGSWTQHFPGRDTFLDATLTWMWMWRRTGLLGENDKMCFDLATWDSGEAVSCMDREPEPAP